MTITKPRFLPVLRGLGFFMGSCLGITLCAISTNRPITYDMMGALVISALGAAVFALIIGATSLD